MVDNMIIEKLIKKQLNENGVFTQFKIFSEFQADWICLLEERYKQREMI